MGHLNRPNQNEDDIPHELTLKEEEIEVEIESDVQEHVDILIRLQNVTGDCGHHRRRSPC
ncbi:hypothetical protein FRX31_027177 [Thalictrum thalictroides]|uniref:Uncharacterized protein n=1 Tax=Thalictrum thalictroides TaxID=46969 RepID=A0A7J6VEQ2_THATH|nr:hypothetical protein FRX31_027177 [Thalictrum thalictroides]